MKHYRDEWIQKWCEDNGWTDLSRQRYNQYWAFPPHGVMPEPIPPKVLRLIKKEKGLCLEEKLWIWSAIVTTLTALIFTFTLLSPMPLVFAFAFDSVAVAILEVEDI